MLFDQFGAESKRLEAKVRRLENFHRSGLGWVTVVIFLALAGFVAWATYFEIDEVARAQGEVIASSRVQVIQAVDGGVLSELLVREAIRCAKEMCWRV